MENLQFESTRFQLRELGLGLLTRINGKISSITETDNQNSSNNWSEKQIANHIFLVNEYMICKLEKLIDFLNEGLVNSESEHIESDFRLVETMLNISVFKLKTLPEFQLDLCYSPDELELKLSVQLVKMLKLIKDAPAAFANNYLTEMKVISGIKLDLYQMIYFVLKHAEHHLNQIETLQSINDALNREISEKKYNTNYYLKY